MSKAERTKQFIIEKTAPVFNKKGFTGTTLQDLTRATGLTKGSIYGNFANKDEVALAVFDYNLSLLQKGMNRYMHDSDNAIDKLLSIANFYRLEVKNIMRAGGCPILNTATDADDTHPRLKASVSRCISGWKKNIEKIVEQGIAEKIIRPGINATEFATIYIALIEGGIMMTKTTGNTYFLNTCIDKIESIIMHELMR